MAFRLRQDTEDWFKHISGTPPLGTKFDLYYFCLMLGLATGRSSSPSKRCADVSEFMDNFVADYKPMQRLIISLLLMTEASRLGLELSEKEEMMKKFDELVDPLSSANLTDIGMSKMNEYASGGFDFLTENFETKPYQVEEFILSYVSLLQVAVENNRCWKSYLVKTDTE